MINFLGMDELVVSGHKPAAVPLPSSIPSSIPTILHSTVPNRPIDLNLDKYTSDYLTKAEKLQSTANFHSTEGNNVPNCVTVTSSSPTLTQEKDVQLTI